MDWPVLCCLLLHWIAVCSLAEEKVNFECPEQFGYYPDRADCSRYFVCVFGGALHESCTGGLFFSVELQTCDWPRNVKCNAANGERSNFTNSETLKTAGGGSLPTSTSTTTSQPPSPSRAGSAAFREQPTARKVPNNAASQSVVHEQGVPSRNSVHRTSSTSPAPTITATTPQNDDKEDADTRISAEEEVLLAGFTEVYDVPRTDAKIRKGKCQWCDNNADSTGATRHNNKNRNKGRPHQQRVEERNPPAALQVEASIQPTERHQHHRHQNALAANDDTSNRKAGGGGNTGIVVHADQDDTPTQQPAPYEATATSGDFGNDEASVQGHEIQKTNPVYRSHNQTHQPQVQSQDYYYDSDPEDQLVDKDFDTGKEAEDPDAAYVELSTPATSTTSLKPRPNLSDVPAKRCDPSKCKLPSCFCGGNQAIPGGFKPEDVPQIVLITFDDAVNDINWSLYEQLFYKGRKNPNGCAISATFYVSHEWTDYAKVQTLYSDGHEIASHSITHSYGEDFSTKRWADEIVGQREILHTYAGIKLEDIRGMRAPFLQIGGNKQYQMLYEKGFEYDSSMPVYENKPPFWPYTLDFAAPHECMIPPCPTLAFPGIWEIPLVMWVDLNGGRCSMADACSNPPTAEGVYKMLVKNFERHYTTNRAPFGLFYHSAWFAIPHHKEGFEAFLDALVTMDDVFVINSHQLVQWLRNPTPLGKIKEFSPWQCRTRDRVPPCKKPKVCNLWFKGGVRYMKTCQPCPSVYPWTSNVAGNASNVTTTPRTS